MTSRVKMKYDYKSTQQQHNRRFTATIQVNLRQPTPPVKNLRISLVQSFTTRIGLLAATSAHLD